MKVAIQHTANAGPTRYNAKRRVKTCTKIRTRAIKVALIVAKYAFLLAVGVVLFKQANAYAYAQRGYEAIGGEGFFLLLPLLWYLITTTIRDTVRDMRKEAEKE